MTTTPSTRDYAGTLMINADALAHDIGEIMDLEQNSWVFGRMWASQIEDVERHIIEMRNTIKRIRGDFANISD